MPVKGLKSAGTTLWLGTTATDGSADTYVEVKGVKIVPTATGGQWQMADSTVLADTDKQSVKTLLDEADIDVTGNLVRGASGAQFEPGQLAMYNAFLDTTDSLYNLEIRFPQGDKVRRKSKVTSFTTEVGNNTAFQTFKSRIENSGTATYVAAS